MSLIFNLVPACLNDVKDPPPPAPGFWQIEGGKVMEREKIHVADYSSVSRVTCATQEHKTAMVWLTLFFLKGNPNDPPENITLHGSQNISSKGEIGSVSAASLAFAAEIGKPFKRVANVLTIG
jgi:hypothetical protein